MGSLLTTLGGEPGSSAGQKERGRLHEAHKHARSPRLRVITASTSALPGEERVDPIGSPNAARSKGLAIFEDMIYFDAPDGFLVALDAATGKLRWETKVHDFEDRTQHTGGPMVADGKVITFRTCETRAGCFISAHDARSVRPPRAHNAIYVFALPVQ